MPRKSRIDAAGALHHVIMRGIERSSIFRNDVDRNDFLTRLTLILKETKTVCYAWALIPNHIHLLIKTGNAPLSSVMRRLLTGYAVSYNRRHKRHGHLFQNRYKSILCQKDAYFLELVRYIHLNPLRSGLVADMNGLDQSLLCGHAVILGKRTNDWQDTKEVLRLFADSPPLARRRYRSFVEKGIEEGQRIDLTGGGLVRSSGGWLNVAEMRRNKTLQRFDERMLGDSAFVEEVLKSAQEQMDRSYRLKAQGFDLDRLIRHVCTVMNTDRKELFAAGKERTGVHARDLLCYLAVRELGILQVEMASLLTLSPAAVTFAVKRGKRIARERNISPSGNDMWRI